MCDPASSGFVDLDRGSFSWIDDEKCLDLRVEKLETSNNLADLANRPFDEPGFALGGGDAGTGRVFRR